MKTKPNISKCPHLLDNQIVYCKITAGGLFIPMPEHQELFCLTKKYKSCFQYQKAADLLLQAEKYDGSTIAAARRSNYRFKQRLPLYIDTDGSNISSMRIEENRAYTVDISEGGFRLATKKRLNPEQEIAFVFDDEFSKPFLTGVGQIRWSQPSDSKKHFLAGLAFTDSACKKVMSNHLSQMLS